MAESAVTWEPSDEPTRRPVLTPVDDGHVRMAEFRAKVRAAGHSWATGRPGDFTASLTRAAAGDPELARVVRAGGQLLEDFIEGLTRRLEEVADEDDPIPADLAAHLIDGRTAQPEVEERLATAYVVAVIRPQDTAVGWNVSSLRHVLTDEALVTRCDKGLVVLIPDEDEPSATSSLQELTLHFPGEAWVGCARQSRALVSEAFHEADEIARLAAAGRRPCGVYRMDDVLVEYAVTRHDRVMANLLKLIRPLRSHTVLWTTLSAMIDADYIRNDTAKALFIHRSTLDYRLQRIAQVTGHDPTSARGAQVLTAAMIADAMR